MAQRQGGACRQLGRAGQPPVEALHVVVDGLDALDLEEPHLLMPWRELEDEHRHGLEEAAMAQADHAEYLRCASQLAEEVSDRDMVLDEQGRDHEAGRRGEIAVPGGMIAQLRGDVPDGMRQLDRPARG